MSDENISRPCRRAAERGVSLLEIAVVLAIVAVAMVMIMPALAGLTRNTNEQAAAQQLRNIHRAIFGSPAEGEFGFVGDMGRLPNTLSELLTQGTMVGFHTADGGTAHAGEVGYGWNGPYLRSVFSSADLTTDPWGQSLSYTATGSTAGQIISAGADGQVGTGDDIRFPASAPPVTGTVFVTVAANEIANAFGAAAKMYYPVNGDEVVTGTQKNEPNDNNYRGFVFTNIPAGVRVLTVMQTGPGCPNCGTVSRTVPVEVVAGQTVAVEVRMTTNCQVMLVGNLQCPIPD